MKLKNVLIIAFLVLTLIPIGFVSLMLYQSGLSLSRESYTRNLIESMNVQADFISQTIENTMISDYRFVSRNELLLTGEEQASDSQEDSLYTAFLSYLESSEDKISVCMLLDKKGNPVYTIGEKPALDNIISQLPEISGMTEQRLLEVELEEGTYSLGIITPVLNKEGDYSGTLLSVYDKSYIFKIISSYYNVAGTGIYISRNNGQLIKVGLETDYDTSDVEQVLQEVKFEQEDFIRSEAGTPIIGYYKNIFNSPWYLVGFVNDMQVRSFTNQFVKVYIFIILAVLAADIALAVFFSSKVVKPIYNLIQVMDDYQNHLKSDQSLDHKSGYYETRYLHSKFRSLMKRILLFQHNYEGIYQLYQSSDMGDINIDIDVQKQIASSNKDAFQTMMNELVIPEGACVVERFTRCFCDKDQEMLMSMLETMRDQHLAVTREAEVYTPYLNEKWFHTVIVPMYEDDRLSRLFIQLRDISSFRKQESDSIELSRRDVLTGLYNRAGFSWRIEQFLLTDKSAGDLYALLFIDMNYFKMVNDNLGHKEGDNLLYDIGRILLNTIGPSDIASRIGGDEFTVFLPHTSEHRINSIREELNKNLIFPYRTEYISFVVSASIGVSVLNHLSIDLVEKMLQDADAAMYETKREFKQNQTVE